MADWVQPLSDSFILWSISIFDCDVSFCKLAPRVLAWFPSVDGVGVVSTTLTERRRLQKFAGCRPLDCTVSVSADSTVSRFPVSDSTSLDAVTDCVHESLPFMNVGHIPPLLFKLSTDPEDAPWEHLDSPDDWDHAVSRVRDKKARIGFSELVCHVIQSATLMPTLIPTLTRGDEGNGLWIKHLDCRKKTRINGPLAASCVVW